MASKIFWLGERGIPGSTNWMRSEMKGSANLGERELSGGFRVWSGRNFSQFLWRSAPSGKYLVSYLG